MIVYVAVFDFWGENGVGIGGASADFLEAKRIHDDLGLPDTRIEAWCGDRLLVDDCKEAVAEDIGMDEPASSMNGRTDADWGIPADMNKHDRAIWLRRCKALNMTYQEWRDFERPYLLEYIQRHPAVVEFLAAKIIEEFGPNQ